MKSNLKRPGRSLSQTKPIKLSVRCLPVAGTENPYQKLMMEGLRSSGLKVQHGESGKFFALIKTVLRHKPDYLHIDWLHSYYIRRRLWMTWIQFPFFVLQVFTITNVLGVKLVWTLHNIYPHDTPKHGPYKWARQFFANQCEWIRVFDDDTIPRAAFALKVSSRKFRVVPEGSYVRYYKDGVNQTEARKHLNLPLTKRILLYLGLIKPYKGILELIEAFQKCKLENTLMLIVGKSMDSKYFEEIKSFRHTPDIIIQEGFVPEDDLQYYFNASDIVVYPFDRIENSGSAIMAMGFKKPIIAPRKGVLKSRLSQQEGLLFKDGGLKSILKSISKMNSETLAEIGAENFKTLNKHRWEDFGSLFSNFYS